METMKFTFTQKKDWTKLLDELRVIQKYYRDYREEASKLEDEIYSIIQKRTLTDEVENEMIAIHNKLFEKRTTVAGKIRIIKKGVKEMRASIK